MKKSNQSWLYASTALILALGVGTVVTIAASPQAVVSADTIQQDSTAVSSAGAAVESAGSALTLAASSATDTGITVSSGASNVSPSYAHPSSVTSTAVSNANASNVSSYTSAASSAAAYMSSEATSLSNVTASYSAVVNSYNTASDSAETNNSLLWIADGVSVYGSYNSAYADNGTGTEGSTSYYDYTVVASEASLTALLGSEYISGAVTATNDISDVVGATYAGGTFTVADPAEGVSFTMNDVGVTNTGKTVNAVYTVTFGDSTTAGKNFNIDPTLQFALASNYPYLKYTISFSDSDGNLVNGLFTGVTSDIDDDDVGSITDLSYLEGLGVYGLNDLTILNPDDSTLVSQTSLLSGYYAVAQKVTTNVNKNSAIPKGSYSYTGWGNSITFVQNERTSLITEEGIGAHSVAIVGKGVFSMVTTFVQSSYIIKTTAPTAKIVYVSVDKPILYELVTPPVDKPTPPKTPGVPETPTTPQTPATPQTPMTKTPVSPKVSALAANPVVAPTAGILPSTGDSAGSSSLMYGGFAVLGALAIAGIYSRKRRRLIEDAERAGEGARKID